MEIKFLGAAGTVTGSKTLIRSKEVSVLLDCGLFQGLKELRLRNWDKFEIDPASLDAIVLTHAHIDHSGFIPVLIKQGFSGKIFCTEPTLELCRILLPDCGRINEEDAGYANRKNYSKHKPALALYTESEAFDSLSYFRPVALNQDISIGHLNFSFSRAGHILGAAQVLVKDGAEEVLFSGDIGRPGDFIECPPDTSVSAPTIVMESTYGDRDHEGRDPIEALGEVVATVKERGSVLLVPVFAVGRAQSILYALSRLFKNQPELQMPVYLDSPMATDVTHLYQKFTDWHRLDLSQCEEACQTARFIRSTEESKNLGFKKPPMIILSASGMLTGGRILHHITRFGTEPRNIILLSGYQAAGTRGATLASGGKELKIHGHLVHIAAEVRQFDLFSAHADQSELLGWLFKRQCLPRRIIINHGESKGPVGLRKCINERNAQIEVEIAENNKAYRIS